MLILWWCRASAIISPKHLAPMPRRSSTGASIGRPRGLRPTSGYSRGVRRRLLPWVPSRAWQISALPARSWCAFSQTRTGRLSSGISFSRPLLCDAGFRDISSVRATGVLSRQARIDRAWASDIKAEHSRGIAACYLGQRCLVHPMHPRNMSDWIVFGHVERVVGAHDDAVGAEHVDQIGQLVIAENHGVEIDLQQIGRWRQRQLAMRILPRGP